MTRLRETAAWLFAPLNLAAYLTWGAVLYAMALSPRALARQATPGATTWIVLLLVLFLAAFVLRQARGDDGRRSIESKFWLAVQVAAGLVATGFEQNMAPILLVIVAAQLPSEFRPLGIVAILGLIDTALWLQLSNRWGPENATPAIAAYIGFQAFAAMTAHYAARSELANQELAQVNAQLLSTRSLLAESARDAERLKLSRELHDVAGHKLTALKLNLAALSRDPGQPGQPGLKLCAQLADELLGDIRAVVRQMRQYDGMDLSSAIQSLVLPVPRPQVLVDVQPDARAGSLHQADAVVRAAQEGLTNALRHAAADHVWISVRREAENLVLEVRDDGRGMAGMQPGIGLQGMRERLAESGGTLEILSSPQRGSHLRMIVPMEDPGTSMAAST